MIKIIKAGGFGYYDGRKHHVYTRESGNIKLTADAEARWVEKGIAEYVGAPKKVETAKYADGGSITLDQFDAAFNGVSKENHEAETLEETEYNEAELLEETVEYSPDMKLADLKAIGEQYGLEVKSFKSKAEVIAVLDSYFAAKASDNEPPPVFGTGS